MLGYCEWIRRFVHFHGKRHPSALGAAEVEQFLTSLAVDRRVAASTQNQAKSALLFLYREVLGVELPWCQATSGFDPRATSRIDPLVQVNFSNSLSAARCGTSPERRFSRRR